MLEIILSTFPGVLFFPCLLAAVDVLETFPFQDTLVFYPSLLHAYCRLILLDWAVKHWDN